MNGSDIKKAVINKAKQTIGEVQGVSSNGSANNQNKKRRKQELKPIITTDKGNHS